MVSVISWRWHPQPGALQQIGHSQLELAERSLTGGAADDKDEIVAWRDLGIVSPDSLAHATLHAVTVVRFAELLADDKATARPPNPITCRIQ